MKVISRKVFEVTCVIPETPEEDQEIKKIIREVKTEKIDLSQMKRVDNRKNQSMEAPD